jgi:nuclear GTP-binding protein
VPQVLDARDPMGCRNIALEEHILKSGANKRIVLVLNKIDLVPRPVVEGWLKYLRNFFPTVAFKSSTQAQRTNLGQAKEAAVATTSESVGGDQLVQLLKNYCRNKDIKTAIRVGVIGATCVCVCVCVCVSV